MDDMDGMGKPISEKTVFGGIWVMNYASLISRKNLSPHFAPECFTCHLCSRVAGEASLVQLTLQ
jgi:hypothetical protein